MYPMQKKSIVLALAATLSGAAFAQSNVTVYGVIDNGYVHSSGDRAAGGSANFSGINSGLVGGSRIGFRGEESLGNGLKALFVLEYSLATDTNGAIGNSRQQYIGLRDDKLGALSLGHQYAPGYSLTARSNPFGGSTAQAPLTLLAAFGNTITGNGAARISNSIAYASPKLGGFTVNAIYGFGENGVAGGAADVAGVSVGNDGLFGAGMNYSNGPLNVDLAYQQRNKTANRYHATGAPAAQKDVNEWAAAASYDFKVVKLFGSYQTLDDKNGTSATEGSNRIWSTGVNVPVFGNGSIQLAYARLDWDRTAAGSSDSWALGYRHALSKRTTLYTSYTVTDNDRNALAAAGYVAKTRALGEKNATFLAGVNHTF